MGSPGFLFAQKKLDIPGSFPYFEYMRGIPEIPDVAKKKKGNVQLRAEFGQKFALFTIHAYTIYGIIFVVTDFHRTALAQNKRFKRGGTLCDGYKRISYHQRRRAKDLVIIDAKGVLIWKYISEYDILAEIWKGLKGIWGGDWFKKGKTTFNDIYHFQY